MAVGNSDHLTLLNSYKVQIRRAGQETGLYSRAPGCVILLESVCCVEKILRDSTPRVVGYTRSPKNLYKNFFFNFSLVLQYYSLYIFGGRGRGRGWANKVCYG